MSHVRFALLEQNALDDAHFLCFLAHIDQTLVRFVAVIG